MAESDSDIIFANVIFEMFPELLRDIDHSLDLILLAPLVHHFPRLPLQANPPARASSRAGDDIWADHSLRTAHNL